MHLSPSNKEKKTYIYGLESLTSIGVFCVPGSVVSAATKHTVRRVVLLFTSRGKLETSLSGFSKDE